MDTYKIVYDEEISDLYGISIVDDPANGAFFLTLSDQKQLKVTMADEKKKLLTGIVLMPEQKIYREFEDGTPFLLMFGASEIEKFSQDFMKKGYQRNTSYNHDNQNWLDGTVITESWIVEDPNNDKLGALGFKDFPRGTWAITMKLSDALWQQYIETGMAKGFSIDSFLRFEKINLNKTQPEMKKTSFLQKLVNLFAEGNISLMDVDSDKGMLTADALEVGNIVYGPDMQPFVDGEFTFENKVYKTDATGAITEVMDAPAATEENLEGENLEDTVKEVMTPEEVQILKDKIAELEATIADMTKVEEVLKSENTDLKTENVGLKAKEATLKLGASENKKVNPINFTTKEKSEESALEAISRITKSNI